MLQWMGGSRRKMATSRKSTQKRQKQYFEQRKRQQQQQQASGAEDIILEDNVGRLQNKNNRSLDVLSLLNLSAISQEHKSSCPSARNETKGNTVTPDYQTVQSPTAIRTNNVNPADAFKTTEARTSSYYEEATTYPKKISVNTLGSHEEASKENHERVNHLKMATERPLSVIELLGDDGARGNSEEGALHEAHVAFSIEGLGKVGTETPVHSPNVHRTLSCGLSSPSQSKRRAPSIKNFSCGSDTAKPNLDSMMWEIDLHPYASSMERPSCSRGPVELFGNQKSKSSPGRAFSLLNSDCSNLTDLFEDDELFYHGKTRNDNFWSGSSSFSPSTILHEEDYSLSCGKWVDQMDAGFADYLDIRNPGKQDLKFESSYLHKKRTNVDATGKPTILETPHLHFQHQSPENHHDFDLSDETWKFMAGRGAGVRQVEKEPLWSCFATEDAGESLSLLSEESCSSTAVRADATKNPSKTLEECSYGIDSVSHGNKWIWKTTSANERSCIDTNTHGKAGNKNGWRRSNRELSSPKSAHNSDTMYEKYVDRDMNRFFGAGFDISENLSSNTFYQTPDPKKQATPSDIWTEDMSNGSPYMDRSKRPSEYPSKISPCSKFVSKKLDFGQPFSDMCFLDDFLPNPMSGYSVPNLSHNSIKGRRDRSSLNTLGSSGSAEKCSGSAGKITNTMPVDGEKFESEVDVSGSNGLSMETESNTSEFEEKFSDCEAPRTRTPEQKIVEATKALDNTEDTSSSVEISNILDGRQGNVNEKEYEKAKISHSLLALIHRMQTGFKLKEFTIAFRCQHDTQISFPCQTGLEDSEIRERRATHDGSTDPTCQILILESCVHQLLRVQVLKEASPDGNIKKIPQERSMG